MTSDENRSKMQYVSIMSCRGVRSGAVHTNLEVCLQRCAEDIFGEIPDVDSDYSEAWGAIETQLREDGTVYFDDGVIRIAKVET